MASIRLSDVSLTLPVRAGLSSSRPKRALSGGAFGHLVNRAARRRVQVDVLERITLSVGPGERVGIMGRNGSGKSSLLRVMAGIYEPVTGTVEVEGWSSPFLELSAGFEPEESGYDNIYYRGYLLGLNKATIDEHLHEIIEFAELGDFIYLPVYTYSSGMRARLAFAVSTCVAPDILLLDEWVGAGDGAFLEKAKQRMMGFVMKARVLVFVTHNRSMLRQVCDRGLILDKGQIILDGPIEETVGHYEREILQLPRRGAKRPRGPGNIHRHSQPQSQVSPEGDSDRSSQAVERPSANDRQREDA
jgi:ABC-2 type transport system ATP-binding protein/lipopolysaccharide transport system ATP-binding protein